MRAKGRIEKLERRLGVNEEQTKIVLDLVYESNDSDEAKWKSEGFVKEGNSWVRSVDCGRFGPSRRAPAGGRAIIRTVYQISKQKEAIEKSA
jgi:hypothetical protein